MYIICIESSHQRGMGHFYRALIIQEYLKKKKEKNLIVVNDDKVSIKILREKNIAYETVDYSDVTSNWEKRIICKYHVNVWLLDKFETGWELVEHIKGEDIILAAIDDRGVGAKSVDLHFCGMLFHDLKGKHIYSGKDYLILNPEIAKYRRHRNELKKVIVTMGGSDTYGVTVNVVKMLKEQGYGADIIVGPGFRHMDLLEKEIDGRFSVYSSVPSLIEMFYEYDLAITGGGVTCFEANASGLPCFIIANELHEIETGKYLAGFQGARFAGYYEDISEGDFNLNNIPIREMSRAALRVLTLNGIDNIYKVIQDYRSKRNVG